MNIERQYLVHSTLVLSVHFREINSVGTEVSYSLHSVKGDTSSFLPLGFFTLSAMNFKGLALD